MDEEQEAIAMFQKRPQSLAALLILSLAELSALAAPAQETTEPATESRPAQSSEDQAPAAEPTGQSEQTSEGAVEPAKEEPLTAAEGSSSEVASSEGSEETEEDDTGVDLHDNLFKLKSVTAGALGPAGFIKGAKTEDRDHSALIAASEERQGVTGEPNPTSTAAAPGSTPEQRQKAEPSTDSDREPSTGEASITDNSREKAEKTEEKTVDDTEKPPSR